MLMKAFTLGVRQWDLSPPIHCLLDPPPHTTTTTKRKQWLCYVHIQYVAPIMQSKKKKVRLTLCINYYFSVRYFRSQRVFLKLLEVFIYWKLFCYNLSDILFACCWLCMSFVVESMISTPAILSFVIKFCWKRDIWMKQSMTIDTVDEWNKHNNEDRGLWMVISLANINITLGEKYTFCPLLRTRTLLLLSKLQTDDVFDPCFQIIPSYRIQMIVHVVGAVVAEWLSSWLAEQFKRSGGRFPASPLEFQRLVISCFQVAIWVKYR